MTDEERVDNAVITALCLRDSGMEELSDTSLIYRIVEALGVEFDLVNRVFTNRLLQRRRQS